MPDNELHRTAVSHVEDFVYVPGAGRHDPGLGARRQRRHRDVRPLHRVTPAGYTHDVVTYRQVVAGSAARARVPRGQGTLGLVAYERTD